MWSDVLTGVSQYSYNTSNVSTYGLRNNSTSSIEEYARSILGDDLGDYEIVDFGSKALLSPQSESSGVSTYSLPRSTNLDYTYSVESDEIGNITNIDGIEIEWNGRRAVGVQKGNNTITYEYNIDGQRVSKTVNGVKTEYFYNGDILAGQKTGNDTVIFMYDNNGDIFGFNYNGEEYYYVKNAQNDVVLILNGDRTAAVIYMYDAWGNITGALDLSVDRISNINPILYRSYYYDIEMGVYYLNSRYYAPLICRFMSGDSLVSGTGGDILGYNMFAYCMNNPVNYCDPNGNWLEELKETAKKIANWVDDKIIQPVKNFVTNVCNNLGITVTASSSLYNETIYDGYLFDVLEESSVSGEIGNSNTVTPYINTNDMHLGVQANISDNISIKSEVGLLATIASETSINCSSAQGTVPCVWMMINL